MSLSFASRTGMILQTELTFVHNQDYISLCKEVLCLVPKVTRWWARDNRHPPYTSQFIFSLYSVVCKIILCATLTLVSLKAVLYVDVILIRTVF